MKVQNGFYAARKSDGGVKTIFIDEEALEMQRQNNIVAERRARAAREEAQAVAAAKERWAASIVEDARREAAYERQQKKTRRLILKELKLLGMALLVMLGQELGLVDWTFGVPVLVGIQTVICFQAGKWFGRRGGRNGHAE